MEGARGGEEFRPHPDTRRLYYTYLTAPAAVAGIAVAAVTVSAYYFAFPSPWAVAVSLVVPYLAVVGFVAYWVPRYISTVAFTLGEVRIVCEGGLWWKRKSFVPYNRITNVDVVQGPVSRAFGLGKVSVQTAGYSGPSGGRTGFAELSIFGVKNFDEVKDAIMAKVATQRPIAVEAGTEESEVVSELRRIRSGVEELVRRG